MEIINIEQGTDEWFRQRIASIGGTAIDKIAPNGKQRDDLIHSFAAELVTSVPTETFRFQHAERGHENEDVACQQYEFLTGNKVYHVGLIKGDLPRRHCSPDGLIEKDGGLEIKTRIPSIFSRAVSVGYFPLAVKRQIQWSLHISHRQWWDYVQYCPEIDAVGLNPFVIRRVERDEVMITELETAAAAFLEDMLRQADRIVNR